MLEGNCRDPWPKGTKSLQVKILKIILKRIPRNFKENFTKMFKKVVRNFKDNLRQNFYMVSTRMEK